MLQIVLATYNGAAFLEPQLVSLISQSYRDFEILVCDDGSTDGTLEIVERYCRFDARIRIVDTHRKHKGAAINFLDGIAATSAPYVMLCDQDDIWFDKKVERMLKAIRNFEANEGKNSACLLYSNAYFFDDDSFKVGNLATRVYPVDLKSLLFLNAGVQGSSMIFNRALVDLLVAHSCDVCMHDHYITLVAAVFGKICLLNIPTMLYRQHSNNVTGNNNIGLVLKAIRQLSTRRFTLDNAHYEAVKSYYSAAVASMSGINKNLILAYLEFPYKSRLGRLVNVLRNGFNANGSVAVVALKALIKKPIGANGRLKVCHWDPFN